MNARADGRPKYTERKYPYGVTIRNRKKKPWIVKFKRGKQDIYVGSFASYVEACAAAAAYLAANPVRQTDVNA